MLLLRRCSTCQSLQPSHLESLFRQSLAASPLQQVLVASPSHQAGGGAPDCSARNAPCSPGPGSARSFNARAAAANLIQGASDLFNIPAMMNPDKYNANERQAAEKFKFYGKVMYPYYRPKPIPWNLYANDNEGWAELERRTRYFWNRNWAQRVCRQSLWGFSNKALKQHAIRVYCEVNEALAQGHSGKAALLPIKELVVPSLFDQLQGEASRLRGSGRQVAWRMVRPPTLADVKIVNGYLAKAVDSAQVSIKLHFVQWTLEIQSEQTFAVYGKGARLLAGDPDKPIKVVDYWVFERPVFKSMFVPKPGPQGATWRLAARLEQPQGRAPPVPPAPV